MTSTKPLSQLPFAVDNKFKLYLRGVLLLPQKKKRVFRPLFLLLRLAFNFIFYLFHHGAMYGTAFETLKASSKNDVSTRNNQEQTQTVLFPILVEDRSLQARSISRLGCRLSGIEIEKRKGKKRKRKVRVTLSWRGSVVLY